MSRYFDQMNLCNFLFPKIRDFYLDISKIENFSKNFINNNYIFYFGDSVIERISRNDKDKRTIDQILGDQLKKTYELVCLSHSAYHLGVYYSLISIFTKYQYYPKCIIVPLNVRSFSPQWFNNPLWQFNFEITLINKFLDNPDSRVFRYHVEKKMAFSKKKYMDTHVVYPLVPFNKIRDFIEWEKKIPASNEEFKYRKKVIFIFHYLYQLNAHHVRLKQLINICNIIQENKKIKIIFYITPINYNAGKKFVGDDFTKYFNKNLEVISDIMMQFKDCSNIKFIDLSKTFSGDLFFHNDLATEHLNERGRKKLASILSDEIIKL